jgi:hypothetical protein
MVQTNNPNDTYRVPNRLAAEKEPRPISTVGGGRGGSLIAFAQGQGGAQT